MSDSPEQAIIRQAFATACGVLAAIYLALVMNLGEPYWAAISAIIISNVDRDALFTKGALRIAGTLVGAIGGYYVSQWVEGIAVQQAAFVALAAAVGTYGRQRSAYGYVWFYSSITFILVLLYTMVEPGNLYEFAHYRCYEIIVGVLCGTLANFAFGPRAGELPARFVTQTTQTEESAQRQALIAGVGALTILIVWSLFDLPQLPQVLASSLVVIDSDPQASRQRSAQRILGCILGGTSGLLVVIADATDIWWWIAMIFVGVFSFARIHLAKSNNAYIGTQAAVAYLVTLVGPAPPSSLDAPVNRLVGIVIGVSIISVVIWALTPRGSAPKAAQQ